MYARSTPSSTKPSRSRTARIGPFVTAVVACTRPAACASKRCVVSSSTASEPRPRPRVSSRVELDPDLVDARRHRAGRMPCLDVADDAARPGRRRAPAARPRTRPSARSGGAGRGARSPGPDSSRRATATRASARAARRPRRGDRAQHDALSANRPLLARHAAMVRKRREAALGPPLASTPSPSGARVAAAPHALPDDGVTPSIGPGWAGSHPSSGGGGRARSPSCAAGRAPPTPRAGSPSGRRRSTCPSSASDGG